MGRDRNLESKAKIKNMEEYFPLIWTNVQNARRAANRFLGLSVFIENN